MSEIPLTTMECCKLSNVPVICHGLCTPAIAIGRSVHEKGFKRLNTCSQYTDIIDKCFSTPNNNGKISSRCSYLHIAIISNLNIFIHLCNAFFSIFNKNFS